MSLLTVNPRTERRPPSEAEFLNSLRVAVVHYWMNGCGGGERVIEAIAEIFPQAEFFSPVAVRSSLPPGIRGRRIRSSRLGMIPGIRKLYRQFLPLYPYALEQFDLSGYDLIISSESGPAKGVITAPGACHVCYCHTPMRYIWDMYHEYRKRMNPFTRAIFSLAAHYLRLWDATTAARVDYFIANSRHVASRIRKYYRRPSTVIYPPVDVSSGYISPVIEDYYLIVSRLVPYKRVDLAVEACNRLGRRLRVVGAGPEYKRLKRLAGPTIEFLGALDAHSLRQNYARCRALIFPGEEDFGITPVEAQSFGRPVIAYRRGGALETVIGLDDAAQCNRTECTGLFFDYPSVDALTECLLRFDQAAALFQPTAIRAHARRFDKARFLREFARYVVRRMTEFRQETVPGENAEVTM